MDNQNDLFTMAEWKEIQSKLSKKMNQIQKEGIDQSTARHMAAAEVGSGLVPPSSAEELESKLARSRNVLFRDNIIKGRKGKNHNIQLPMQMKPNGNGNGDLTLTDRYIQYCKTHNYIPTDEAIAFFTGKSRQALYHPKKKLIDLGYKFEERDWGSIIIERPIETVTITEDEYKMFTQAFEFVQKLKKDGRLEIVHAK